MALTFQPDNSRNGGQQLVVSAGDLPQFLIDAKVAIEDGRVEDAKQLLSDRVLNETLENDPSRTDIMFMLGLMFGKIGLTHKAEQWYRKVLEVEPNAHTFYKLGRICRSTNRISEADEFAAKALQAEPENTLFQISFALDTIREGKARDGVQLLHRVVDRDPGNIDAHSKLLFHMHFLPELDQQKLFEEHRRWGAAHAPLSRAKTNHTNNPEHEHYVGSRRIVLKRFVENAVT